MKRLLLSVFAVAVAAAWAVPSANAAEVAFSGQYRLRGEYKNNADSIESNGTTNNTANDHAAFWGQRVRLTADAKATDDTTVKITLQDTRNWGASPNANGGPGLTDSTGCTSTYAAGPPIKVTTTCTGNTTDLHESYVNIENLFGAPVALKAGRQELAYGDERLVGSFGWSNNGRSFDALKFVVKSDAVNIDVFDAKVVERTTTATDQDFYGVYATLKSIPNNTVDLYVLALRDQGNQGLVTSTNTAFGWAGNSAGTASGIGNTKITGNIQGTQTLTTYGFRVKGAVSGLDYTLEMPFQTGRVKQTGAGLHDIKITASAYAAKAGYTLPGDAKIRVGAEYDFASGDKDGSCVSCNDNRAHTFSNLFPTNHDKLGIADMQAWRNVRAYNLNVSASPLEKLKLTAAYWSFKLATTGDAWYNSAGAWNNYKAGSAVTASNKVGTEYDLMAAWKYNSSVTFDLGYARFNAGRFIKDNMRPAGSTALPANTDFAYLQLTANF